MISLQELAENASPRAEFLFGLMLLERRKQAEAYYWLERCKRHCNELVLFKLSRVYALLGEKYHQESLSCLKRAAWRKYPSAMKLLKELR